jgi:hypothetical protein
MCLKQIPGVLLGAKATHGALFLPPAPRYVVYSAYIPEFPLYGIVDVKGRLFQNSGLEQPPYMRITRVVQ